MTLLSDTGKPTIIPQSACCTGHSRFCGASGTNDSMYYCCDKCPSAKPKLIISHGDSHPFGEKCKTCDKIKARYIKGYKKGLRNVAGWNKEYEKMKIKKL